MDEGLQKVLDDVQKSIKIWEALPKRKKFRRKYWEAYISCVRIEQLLLHELFYKKCIQKSGSKRVT